MTVIADSLQVAETVIVSCLDVVYLCGFLATEIAPVPVTGKYLFAETTPVTWESSLAGRSLPVTTIFQVLPLY